MITKNPVLLCGRSVWDQSFFPPDEFTERIRLLHSLMAEQGIDALLVYGNGANYANLSYLTHFIPKSGWVIAMIPLAGEPTLFFSAGGDRDIPFAKKVTWINNVRHVKNAGKEIHQLLKEKDRKIKKLAIPDINLMPSHVYDDLLSSIEDVKVTEANPLMRVVRAKLRARERSAITHAASIIGAAKNKVVQCLRAHEPIQKALLKAELEARKLGGHDVRVLTLGDHHPFLFPLGDPDLPGSDRLVAYIAVEFQGYWADLALTSPVPKSELAEKAAHALRSMVAATKPGKRAGDVAGHAVEELGPELAGIALEMGLGNGVGLSLQEPPCITIGGEDELIEGNVLSLKVYAHDGRNAVFFSDLVLIDEKGCKSIIRSDLLNGR